MKTSDSNPAKMSKIGSSLKNVFAPIIGIVALLGFAVFTIFLLTRIARAEELEWTRAIYLLSGVEAIAFAAAGFFFGKEVHRERAEKAEEDRDKAQNRSSSAEARAVEAETKGRALAAAVRGPSITTAGLKGARLGWEDLKKLADSLFPE